MALIASDGFDHYSTWADVLLRTSANLQWNSAYSCAIVTPGRGGYGKCLSIPAVANNTNGGVHASFSANDATYYFGFAMLWVGVGAGGGFGVYCIDPLTGGGTSQCYLVFQADGTIQAYKGGYGSSALLGSTSPNAYNPTSFQFIEIAATIGSSGSITVQVAGEPVLTLTGINNQSTSNASFGGIEFQLQQSGPVGNVYIDDFRYNDTTTGPGSYPCNAWLGDLRVAALFGIGDGSVAWTKGVTPTLTFGTAPAYSGTFSWNNSTIIYERIQATGGVLTEILCQVASGFTGNVTAALYTDAVLATGATPLPPLPGALICTSAQATNPGAGQLSLSVSSGPTLNGGSFYWIALACSDSGASFGANPSGTLASAIGYSQPVAYGSIFPATASNLAGEIPPVWLGLGVTASHNYQEVGEAAFDGDGSFNYATSLSAEDLINLQALVGTISYVIAVQIIGAFRQTDASAHTITMQCKTAGTDTAGPAHTLALGYQFFADMLAINPTTGSSWTVAEVNAMQIGYTAVT